ncbi:MAG: RNA methyltransferase [Archangiaceae bacterium]|nr:RNA methyltransferase [Archangiaceae bacterium]
MSGGGPGYEPREGVPPPEELLLAPRLERIEQVLKGRTRRFTLVLDQLEDAFNMAAVLRTCEAYGVQDVHVIDNPNAAFKPNATVTQGCDKWLDLHRYRDFADCRAALHQAGFKVLASQVREGATPLEAIDFDHKVALVLGNERFGVRREVIDQSDGVFWIPMRGFSQSLNISATASACITRARLGRPGDLSEAEIATLRERFQRLSVKQHKRLYK